MKQRLLPALRFEKRQSARAPTTGDAVQSLQELAALRFRQFAIDQGIEHLEIDQWQVGIDRTHD
jgi:hypothetical protein